MELKMNEKTTEQFKAIKEHAGMNSDKEVLAVLISKEYHRIERLKLHRVFMPKEIYALVEKTAETSKLTVDEFIAEFCDEVLRKAKEKEGEGIQKAKRKVIPIESAVYEELETIAKTQGITVDEYVAQICLNRMQQFEQKVQA